MFHCRHITPLVLSALASCTFSRAPIAGPAIVEPDAGQVGPVAPPSAEPASRVPVQSAEPSVAPPSAATAAADSGGAAGSVLMPAAAGMAAPLPAAPPATVIEQDAGAPAPALDAGPMLDDPTCAFELSACLLANPLGYAECTRANAEHCALVMDMPAADGGTQPSPTCAFEAASCLMRNPLQPDVCMAQLEKCML